MRNRMGVRVRKVGMRYAECEEYDDFTDKGRTGDTGDTRNMGRRAGGGEVGMRYARRYSMKRTFELMPGDRVWDTPSYSNRPLEYVVIMIERYSTDRHLVTLALPGYESSYTCAYLDDKRWEVVEN